MPRAYRMTVVDGVCTVRLVGEIDFANADQVTDWLLNAIDGSKCTRLDMNFAELAFLDSSGIRALLTVYRHAINRDVEVNFHTIQPGVQRTLRLAGVDSLLGTGT
ncbi:STAS domain-containing protein [Allorhizocola rhizosphaerae]|uniref:STAS domain-containing protein n=1 Tax=Allorhizocola rhizosphaerae TaxID=1872709 RepID=UPI0013C3293E|nr:STAS domain-containing protein [Allorhizocola rhizosphaerae]